MEKLNLPNEVIKSKIEDNIDYETYGSDEEEMKYVAPNEIREETIEEIKAKKIGHVALFFAKSSKLHA